MKKLLMILEDLIEDYSIEILKVIIILHFIIIHQNIMMIVKH